jgi:hypothetical protein
MNSEFQRCKHPRDFLRGTTFVSRLISSYTKCVQVLSCAVCHHHRAHHPVISDVFHVSRRQSGRLHLVQTLKEALSSIMNDDKLDVELDPQKVSSAPSHVCVWWTVLS